MIQLFNVARGALDTASSGTILTTLVGDIGDVLAQGMAIVLGLLAVLVGLFFVLRFVWKKIGKAK
jgi:hypothetical protein